MPSADFIVAADLVESSLALLAEILPTIDPNAEVGNPAYEASRASRHHVGEILIELADAVRRMRVPHKVVVPGLTLGHLPGDMIVGRLRTITRYVVIDLR